MGGMAYINGSTDTPQRVAPSVNDILGGALGVVGARAIQSLEMQREKRGLLLARNAQSDQRNAYWRDEVRFGQLPTRRRVRRAISVPVARRAFQATDPHPECLR